MFNVAAIQMVSTDELCRNLETAEKLITEASRRQAKLVTLPENFPFMGRKNDDYLAIMEPIGDGKVQAFLSEQARRHRIWLLGGTVPLASEDPNKAYAGSLLYDPEGKCIAHYNKIHLFDVFVDAARQEAYQESNCFEPGHDCVIARTDVGNIGLSVCYDLRFPELYRQMLRHDVNLITVPAAFTAKTGAAHWKILLRARAIENLCYVVASNQGGTHANQRKTWGHSMIIDPWGTVLAELDKGIGLAVAAIDFDKQKQLREFFPALSHIQKTGDGDRLV